MRNLTGMWTMRRLSRNRQLRGCFILLAIVCIPMVVALVFSESMMGGIIYRFVSFSGGHVRVPGQPDLSQWESGIQSTDTVCTGYAVLYADDAVQELQLKGVPDNFFDSRRADFARIERKDDISGHTIMISRTTAQKLGLGLGDKLTMMVIPSGTNSVVRPVLVYVGAIYDTGYKQIDSLLAFTDLEFANLLYPESLSTEILLYDAEKAQALVKQMNTEGLGATSWVTMAGSVYDNFVLSRQMIFIVLAIVVVLSAFYTASVSNQIINDKAKETQTARLLGAGRGIIMRVSFLSAMLVVLCAQIAGMAAGLGLSFILGPAVSALFRAGALPYLSYYLLDFKVTVPWSGILTIMGLMLCISAISVLLSLKAVKKTTVK